MRGWLFSARAKPPARDGSTRPEKTSLARLHSGTLTDLVEAADRQGRAAVEAFLERAVERTASLLASHGKALEAPAVDKAVTTVFDVYLKGDDTTTVTTVHVRRCIWL